MINRRDFLKSAAVIAAFPSSLLACPPMLKWTKFSDDWYFEHYVVSKGPYSASFQTPLNQLADCHGLCATQELLALIVQEIQYGRENLVKMLHMPWGTEQAEQERQKALKSLIRVRLSGDEISEIYNVLKTLRGPHECPLKVHEEWKL